MNIHRALNAHYHIAFQASTLHSKLRDPEKSGHWALFGYTWLDFGDREGVPIDRKLFGDRFERIISLEVPDSYILNDFEKFRFCYLTLRGPDVLPGRPDRDFRSIGPRSGSMSICSWARPMNTCSWAWPSSICSWIRSRKPENQIDVGA